MTKIKSSDLNYDHYSNKKYDQDIVNAIPFHEELHRYIAELIKGNFDSSKECSVLDLGTGTGITAKLVRDLLPKTSIDMVDFSEQMMVGAKRKLGKRNTRYFFGDYSEMHFDKHYDIIISVIGVHHQADKDKQRLFKKVYNLLKPGGIFIFGDLVTYADQQEAARNTALHLHHLVRHASDQKTLTEWAHHHLFLNKLAPVENQINWLEKIGFKIQKKFLKMNTCLLFGFKS